MKNIFKQILFLFFLNFSFAQGGAPNCASLQANPELYQSCATSIPFTNSIVSSSESYSISCFMQPPQAPTWFFIKIKDSGDITLQISQVSNSGTPIDVDFVIWGPFPDLTNICPQLTQNNETDCSWSVNAIENAVITGAISNEYYILLVDNYSQLHGKITISQTDGQGSSDCSFLSSVKIKNIDGSEITQFDYCKPATKNLMAAVDIANFPGAPSNLRFSYKWFKEGVLFSSINSSTSSTNTISVADTGNYKVQVAAYDSSDTSVDPNNLTFTDNQSDTIDLRFFTAANSSIQTSSQCLESNPVLQTTVLNTEIQNYTYQWFMNGAAILGATSSSFTPINVGNYNVAVANAGCLATNSNHVAIYQKPVLTILSDKVICDGDSFQITSVLQNSASLSNLVYQWQKDGITIPAASTNSYTVNSSNQAVNSTHSYTLQATEQGLCSSISNAVSVSIHSLPLLASSPITIIQCDAIAPYNDGFSVTNLANYYNQITNNTAGLTLHFFLNAALTLPISNPNSFTNTIAYNQTIYVTAFDASQNPICTSLPSTILLQIPSNNIAIYPDITGVCPTLNTNFATVDLVAQSLFIKNTFFPTTVVNISFYNNSNDAAIGQNQLTNNTTFPVGMTTVYTKVSAGANCVSFGTFQIEVVASPIQNVISPIFTCKDEMILLSSKDSEALMGQNNFVQASYFLTFDNAKNNISPIDKTIAMPLITGNTIVYVRLFDSNSNCLSIVNFGCNVFQNPIVINPSPIKICGETTASFNLNSRIAQIIGTNSTYQVTFYETLSDWNTGNAIQNPDSYTSTSKIIFVKVIDPNSNNCASKTTLSLQLMKSPGSTINPTPIQICQSNGFAVFDLKQAENEMAGATPLNEISFKYYSNFIDSQSNNSNNIVTPTTFINQTKNYQKIYVRLNSLTNFDSETGEACYKILELELFVRPFPANNLKTVPYSICVDKNNNVVNNAFIDTELTTNNYNFSWFKEHDALIGNSIVGMFNPVFTTGIEGNYSAAIVDTTNSARCKTVVNFSTKNTLIPFSIIGNPVELVAFESENNLTAIATPTSVDFEYMLNDNGWQESPVFENVKGGLYELKVRNKFGCGAISSFVLVVDYPKFFTPNDDGFNDVWNIQGLTGLPHSNTFIFDRFGKLITEIKSSTNGWDGNYDGKPAPSDDYWFKIDYSKNGINYEFRNHFSLKR